ncbi:MAG TPA: cytochrome c [Paracoccaceae bacterium]|nr:cytochrome c [Paracoccaceae bacterium]
MQRTLIAFLAAGLALAAATVAQEPHVSESVLERQARMRAIDNALTTLERMTSGAVPLDAQRAARVAAEIATQTGGLADTFTDTPASRFGPLTRARQEVWQNPGDFLVRMSHLEEGAFSLIGVARAGDPAVLAGAVSDLRAACNACHSVYLAPPP